MKASWALAGTIMSQLHSRVSAAELWKSAALLLLEIAVASTILVRRGCLSPSGTVHHVEYYGSEMYSAPLIPPGHTYPKAAIYNTL